MFTFQVINPMSLFFDVLSSINDPNQQGSVAHLSQIVGNLQQLATTQGLDTAQMQSVLSSVGSFLGPALQQQQGVLGGGQLDNLVGQLGGSGAPATAMQSLIPPQVMQQLLQAVSQKTGLDTGMLQNLLPSLVPTVMGLLNMGASKPGAGGSGNGLLNAFLNGGSGADLGEVFKFANRFLNPPH
jgi:hypothetical protein